MSRLSRVSTLWMVLALSLATTWMGARAASATTMFYVSIDDLYALSDLVVRGTVFEHTTFLSDDGRILTDWTIGVEEVLFGEAVATVTVRQLGGVLDDGTVLYVPGDARLTDGEQVVVFLVLREGGCYLTALGQSKLSVLDEDTATELGVLSAQDEPLTDGPLAVRDLREIEIVAPTGASADVEAIDELEVYSLEALRARVPTP